MGNSGIAPFWVHIQMPEASTTSSAASRTVFPFKIEATKVAVNESPAPTVSATFYLLWSLQMIHYRVKT